MQKVTLKLKINGADKTALITDRLVSLTLTDQAGLDSDTLSLTLDDRAPHIKLPPIKATLQLWLNQTYMGAWQASELETDDRAGTLTIEATGAKMTGAIQAPRDASYDQVTLGQLAATIAQRHGLPLAISAELKAEALGHIDQRAESDLALLTRLTHPLGAIAKLADQKLIIAHKDRAASVSGKPLPAITLNAAAEGIYIRGTIKGRAKAGQTKAYWQTADMPQKQAVTQGAPGQTYTLQGTYNTERAAKAAASAKLKALQRAEVDIQCDLPGHPACKAERPLTLTHHRHAGDYIIQSTTHQIRPNRIYTTALTATTKPAKASTAPKIKPKLT